MSNRRSFLQSALAFGAALTSAPKLFGAAPASMPHMQGMHTGIPILVNTPDLPNLPFKLDGDVKVFNLVARTRKAGGPSRQGRRSLGLQRQRPRPDDSGQFRRPRSHRLR